MSEADKILQDLGYEIDSTYEIKGHLYYCRDYIRIDFDLERKNFYKYNSLGNYRCPIYMQELKAINKKCEELRVV